jgi:hypothetical protein
MYFYFDAVDYTKNTAWFSKNLITSFTHIAYFFVFMTALGHFQDYLM